MPNAAALLKSIRKLRSVARFALRQYGITDAKLLFLSDCKQPAFRIRLPDQTQTGFMDDRYNKNTFLLRIFPEGTRNSVAINSELLWLGHILSDTPLVVPKPVSGADGELVVSVLFPDDRSLYHCSLTHWVKGRIFLRASGPGPHFLRLVGQAMARLHLHGQQFRRDAGFHCPQWNGDGLFGEHSPYFPDAERTILASPERRLYSKVVRQCREAMDKLGEGQDVFGLVHGDLIQLNYLFHKGEVRIIDFGDFGDAHYLYDMAVTLFALRTLIETTHNVGRSLRVTVS